MSSAFKLTNGQADLRPVIFISIFLACVYFGIVLAYWRGWRRIPVWVLPENFSPKTRVSVIIPARNEAGKIGECLRSILAGSYPAELLEILVVDDFSEDETANEMLKTAENQAVKINLLKLAEHLAPGERLNSHKKKAIEIAVAEASGELIVTTDADCVCPVDWLRLIVSIFEKSEKNVQAVAATVLFFQEKNWLQKFQTLDFAGMMGITGAGIAGKFQRLGNGANLAYRKSAFLEVGGFAGADERASGDDVFLLQKIARRWPDGVFFLKNPAATVLTEAQPTWLEFVRQRIRWGTKNTGNQEVGATWRVAAVWFFCVSILGNAAWLVFFPGEKLAAVLLVQLLLKAVSDWIFLREMSSFFGRRELLRLFVPAFFWHIGYIAGVGAGSLVFKKYEWKGRRVG